MRVRSYLWNSELVTAKDGGDPAALHREAERLSELDHPGVVSLAALVDGEGGPLLLTRYAGRHSLNTWQPRRTEDLLAVFEGLAAALAYLHESNLFHLNVCSEHVLIGASQQPLLCSFSAARQADSPEESSELAARDIADLGKTLLRVIDSAPQTLRRQNKRLFERLRALAEAAAEGRVRSTPNLEGHLRSLASREAPVRSTPSEVADPSTPHAEEDSSLPAAASSSPAIGSAKDFVDTEPEPPVAVRKGRLRTLRPLKRSRLLKTAGICAGLVVLAFMTLQLLKKDQTPELFAGTAEDGTAEDVNINAAADQASLEEEASSTQPLDAAADHSENTAPADADTHAQPDDLCRPVSPGYLDVTGDGCAERVTIGAGFVTIDDIPYPVGAPGDQLLVGDWDCDGVSTLALAESSGRVYVFDSWPKDEPLTPTLVEELEPPIRIKKIPDGECDRLATLDGLDIRTLETRTLPPLTQIS